MTTHVFVVDEWTFPVHLQYMFAGTGAKEDDIDFNATAHSSLHHSKERLLAGMAADASRLRPGDQVLFYLTANNTNEGRFFGVFRVGDGMSFVDRNDGRNYLKDRLQKALLFRVLLEPTESVYSFGVTEWEALDEIKHIQAPCQMLWSLIYRKLKGNRGNTMITTYEAERLVKLIRDKNHRTPLACGGSSLVFDQRMCRIAITPGQPANYRGRRDHLDLLPRLIEKLQNGQAFEPHLQAHIVGNLGLGTNRSLDEALLEGGRIHWLGNEVSCGVGMQRIDVMPVTLDGEQRTVAPVELKAVVADESIVFQVQRYVEWVEQYFIPNYPADIRPVIVARRRDHQDAAVLNAFGTFNRRFARRCHPLRYVEYDIVGDNLEFSVVTY